MNSENEPVVDRPAPAAYLTCEVYDLENTRATVLKSGEKYIIRYTCVRLPNPKWGWQHPDPNADITGREIDVCLYSPDDLEIGDKPEDFSQVTTIRSIDELKKAGVMGDSLEFLITPVLPGKNRQTGKRRDYFTISADVLCDATMLVNIKTQLPMESNSQRRSSVTHPSE